MPAEGERDEGRQESEAEKEIGREGGRIEGLGDRGREGGRERVCAVLYNCLQGTSFVLVRGTESY